MLAAAGMVHTHVNDKVLGGRQLAAKDGAAVDDDDGGGGGFGGGGGAGGGVKSEAPPWARPSVKGEGGGAKGEGGGAKGEGEEAKGEGEEAKSKRQAGEAEPPAAKRAKMNAVLNGSENEARHSCPESSLTHCTRTGSYTPPSHRHWVQARTSRARSALSPRPSYQDRGVYMGFGGGPPLRPHPTHRYASCCAAAAPSTRWSTRSGPTPTSRRPCCAASARRARTSSSTASTRCHGSTRDTWT